MSTPEKPSTLRRNAVTIEELIAEFEAEDPTFSAGLAEAQRWLQAMPTEEKEALMRELFVPVASIRKDS